MRTRRCGCATPALRRSGTGSWRSSARFGLRIVVGYAMSESPYGLIWPRGSRPYGTLGTVRQHPELGIVNEARVVGETGGCSARRDRRARAAQSGADAGLLGHAGGDGRGDRRRLAAYRRPGDGRRRRHVHIRRPGQGGASAGAARTCRRSRSRRCSKRTPRCWSARSSACRRSCPRKRSRRSWCPPTGRSWTSRSCARSPPGGSPRSRCRDTGSASTSCRARRPPGWPSTGCPRGHPPGEYDAEA